MPQAPSSLPEPPHINDVVPFGNHDRKCFDEVREVLKRHGALDRFGLTLLHSHFPMSDDEILVESVDPVARTLTLQPEQPDTPRSAIETAWRLDDPSGMQRCEVLCNRIPGPPGQPDAHDRVHYMTG